MSTQLGEWIQEWVALSETREAAAVADCRRALAAARETLGPTAFQEYMGREITETEEERQKWEKSLWASLTQLRRDGLNIDRLAKFKKEQKDIFDQLRGEEFKLLQAGGLADSKSLEEKFDSWLLVNTPSSSGTPASRGSVPAPAQPLQAASSQIKDALTALDLEIDRDGGNTGGWDAEEHAVFLRAVNKPREELHALLPQLSTEEIQLHADWYLNKQVPRQILKKRLLADWRAERDAEVNRKRASQTVNVDLELEAEQRARERDEAATRKAEADAKLEAWRKDKAEKEDQQLQERRRKEALKKVIEAEEAAERARARKEVLERYKQEKQMIQDELLAATDELGNREKLERQLAISASRPRIDYRNEANAARLRALTAAKQEQKERRHMRQAVLTEKVREAICLKVSSRVHEPREQVMGQKEEQEIAVERFLDRFGGRRTLSMGGRAVHVPTLSTPQWRKGISN